MNFRHQVHIGHNDDIDTLNPTKTSKIDSTTNNNVAVVVGKQQQVTSSGNSTLSSRSLSFKDENDDSDQLAE
jgi:hypothetical protein